MRSYFYWSVVVAALLLAGCPANNARKQDGGSPGELGVAVDNGAPGDSSLRVDVTSWPDTTAWPDSAVDPDSGAPADLTSKDTASPFDLSCISILVEAEDSKSVKQQGWSTVSGKVLHGGLGLETATVGATLQLDFKGTDLVVYYENGPNRGEFSVTVDKGTPVKVSCKNSAFTFQNPAVVAKGLANTNHSAVLTCLAKYCSVDYFRIHTCK